MTATSTVIFMRGTLNDTYDIPSQPETRHPAEPSFPRILWQDYLAPRINAAGSPAAVAISGPKAIGTTRKRTPAAEAFNRSKMDAT